MQEPTEFKGEKMLERLELAIDRLREIKAEKRLQKEYQEYFWRF